MLHAVKAGHLNHWITREAPSCSYFIGEGKETQRKAALQAKQPRSERVRKPNVFVSCLKAYPI